MLRFWLPVALSVIACGDVRTVSPPDAAIGGDDSDAAPEPPGLVTVQLDELFESALYGEPMEDVPVLFHGPDRELIAEETTDTDGEASATVPPGSIVTIAMTAGGEQYITLSIFDVQPGDEIVFPSPEPEPGLPAELGTMTIDLPDKAGAAYYRAANGCQEGTSDPATTSSVVLSFDDSCAPGNEFDYVGRAFNDANEVIDITSGHAVFDLSGTVTVSEWTGNDDLEVAVTGIPDSLHTLRVAVTPALGSLRFGPIATEQIEPDNDTTDISVPAIDDFGDGLDVGIEYTAVASNVGAQQAYYRVAPDTADVPLALDDDLLPWFGPPALTDATREISWTRTSSGRADMVYAYLIATPKSGDTFAWLAIVPPDWTSVTLPELPAALADHAAANIEDVVALILHGVESSEYDGYEIRTSPFLPFLATLNGLEVPADPDSGFFLKVSGQGGF
jgi:hypothetical protein